MKDTARCYLREAVNSYGAERADALYEGMRHYTGELMEVVNEAHPDDLPMVLAALDTVEDTVRELPEYKKEEVCNGGGEDVPPAGAGRDAAARRDQSRRRHVRTPGGRNARILNPGQEGDFLPELENPSGNRTLKAERLIGNAGTRTRTRFL